MALSANANILAFAGSTVEAVGTALAEALAKLSA